MLFSKLDLVLKEKVEISSERDSLKTQLDLILKKNEILKSKNDFDVVLKKNNVLSSRLDFVLKENDSLKNKIVLISKELECVSIEKDCLKNDLASHSCHTSIVLPPSYKIFFLLHAPVLLQSLKMIFVF